MGIEILPPDLNASRLRFAPESTPTGKPAIRYGLAAIKNVGEGAMDQAISDRTSSGPFTSLDDFANRLDSKVVNRRILENLVKAGALDWTGQPRAAMFARLEQVTASASSAQRDRATGQVSLFDTLEFAAPPPAAARTEPVPEWPKEERLAHEKELLGFYVTGHPLDRHRGVIDTDRFAKLGLLDEIELKETREKLPFAGMVRSVEHKSTKAGKPFGVLILEDFTGSAEVTLWSETYLPAREAGLLEPGRVIRLRAAVQVDDRTEQRKLTGYDLNEVKARATNGNGANALELSLSTARHGPRDLAEILAAIQAHPGKTPLVLHFHNSAGRRATILAADEFRVRRSPELEQSLARWLA
jgi:DNA polymerase-3 subunit alpha